MKATLFDGTNWNVFHYSSQLHLLQVVDEHGIARVAYWPADAIKYALFFRTGHPRAPVIIAPVSYRHSIDESVVSEAYRWLQTSHATASCNILRERYLRPTPNGGTRRTSADLSEWAETGIDIFTRFYVSKSIKRKKEPDVASCI